MNVQTLIDLNFTDVTDVALQEYCDRLHRQAHNDFADHDYQISTLTVFDLYRQSHPSQYDQFEDDDDQAFDYDNLDDFLNDVTSYFTDQNYRIYQVDYDWFQRTKALYHDLLGIDFTNLISYLSVIDPNDLWDNRNAKTIYVNLPVLENQPANIVKAILNNYLFGGTNQDTKACDWYLNHVKTYQK